MPNSNITANIEWETFLIIGYVVVSFIRLNSPCEICFSFSQIRRFHIMVCRLTEGMLRMLRLCSGMLRL
jgi:hypothetical protein